MLMGCGNVVFQCRLEKELERDNALLIEIILAGCAADSRLTEL
ncbi:hypothetical protein Gorai_014833 [Gossypium raimondii]|uniref:Uncharacterized protein n=1 Tax=Gossypium raimondii TaxID=29730 RepID=A0A7J8P422_GOSRA|nr:hypothetical protein [Gossypium raimondii]